MTIIKMVVSGGQTGVDEAGLRAALDSGIGIGGWCPPGRIREGGIIDKKYPLKETPIERSERAGDIPRSLRTEWNVRDSDGLLILCHATVNLDPGTHWARECSVYYQKPCSIEDPANRSSITRCWKWLNANSIAVLNVGGPSEQTAPGIEQAAYAFLMELFRHR